MTKTELQAMDLYKMRWVLDPALSEDGCIAYVLKDVHPENPEERYRYQLVFLDGNQQAPDGVGQRLLPGFDATVRAPSWSPDGKQLAFLATRSGKNQVWLLTLGTHDLSQLTDHEHGVSGFEWSSDGEWISFVAAVSAKTDELGEEVPGRYRVIRRLGYKHDGVGYWDGTWPQVFIQHVSVSPDESPAQQLTSAKYGEGGARLSPDGAKIATISSGEVDPDRTSVRDIYIHDLSEDDSERSIIDTRQLTKDLAIQSSLSWSPDGRYIAFVADDLSDDRATNAGVWVVAVDGGRVVNLTADIDRPAGDYVTDDMNAEAISTPPVWSNDGNALFCLMSDRGRSRLVRIGFPGDEAFDRGIAASYADEMLVDPWQGSMFNASSLGMEDHRIFAFDTDGSDNFVVAESSVACPGDIFTLRLGENADVSEKQRLTEVNRDLLAERRISDPEPVAFEGSEGRQIEGWLLQPTNGAEAPFPLVLHIHGGPHSAHSMAFNFELQHLAAQGYAVLYTNPHGSHSYGRAINTGTRHDWGGKDYNDLMRAVDVVIERPEIDAERIGVAGGSYGGWMTNYIVTRTNRFRAAVAQRSSANRISTMLSSMVGYMHQRWEAPGYPWEHIDYFVKVSPVLHADKVETPLLLVHAENDHLCPLMQAEEMYTALKAMDRPVELLVFLGESHHLPRLGKAVNRVVRLERTADWFEQYV